MSIYKKILVMGAAIMMSGLSMVAGAVAQDTDYPNQPVTVIVPFGAGGGLDVLTRIVATKLTERTGQPFVVENRGGASGNIGFYAGSRAAPDGYTITMLTQNMAANTPFFDMPFDSLTAFRLVSLITKTFTVLVAHPSVPVDTVEEFIAYARDNPAVVTSGNGGLAGNGYYALELINVAADLNITQASYQGEGPMLVDLIAGQIPVGFSTSAAVEGMIRSGQVKAIGISNPVRSEQFPDVQAIAEVLPGYALNGWWGVGVPVGTPDAIVEKLNTEIRAVLELPDVQQRFAELGAEAEGSTPEEFMAVLEGDLELYRNLVEERGLAP